MEDCKICPQSGWPIGGFVFGLNSPAVMDGRAVLLLADGIL